jgi:hypothetical protein
MDEKIILCITFLIYMPQKKNDFPKGGDKMRTPTILP